MNLLLSLVCNNWILTITFIVVGLVIIVLGLVQAGMMVDEIETNIKEGKL